MRVERLRRDADAFQHALEAERWTLLEALRIRHGSQPHMTDLPSKASIDDVLPGLDHPLWEGTDDTFAAYVQETFGIPANLGSITITPPSTEGRCAVAIGGDAGRILFVISPNATARQTYIAAVVLGALVSNRDVMERAQSSSEDYMQAIVALALRHLPPEVVLRLLAPPPVQEPASD